MRFESADANTPERIAASTKIMITGESRPIMSTQTECCAEETRKTVPSLNRVAK